MKGILKIFAVITVLIISFNVFAITDPVLTKPGNGTVVGNVGQTTKNVWATVVTVVQIVAVACVVFAGLRYMFASADQKADIKQGMIFLSLGAVLVFGATLIIRLVADAAETIL